MGLQSAPGEHPLLKLCALSVLIDYRNNQAKMHLSCSLHEDLAKSNQDLKILMALPHDLAGATAVLRKVEWAYQMCRAYQTATAAAHEDLRLFVSSQTVS